MIGQGSFNEDGEPIAASAPSFSESIECRYVQGGKENLRFLSSGTYIIYDYVVYCDYSKSLVGKTIQLFNEENELVDEKVVRDSSLGQLQTILYL